MESPVVLDKPTEYHGNKGDERGFPFDEEESDAWSSLAARHPDIAARLRQRPATWARKRRPSSQDPTDDFGDNFSGFDRFPFEDIPAEFREHFPAHWARRFEDAPPSSPPPPSQPAPAQASPPPAPAPAPATPQQQIPQYGLRNTVDLGQRSAAEPPVDAEERVRRATSAPPQPAMSAPPPPREREHEHEHATVRHIPIFVEGRDEPVLNRDAPDHADAKPQPPPQPHVDRDAYFADDGPATFHHPPNFSRAFGTPFNKGFRQGPQPFVQQKVYPQTAFARGASPQRSQSPKAQPHPEEHHAKHEPAARAQPPQQPQQHPPQQPPQQEPQQQPRAASPPPKSQPSSNDPITQILIIQTDVLNLMSEVENFLGTKKDKRYMFLDEMLTRNLIKLDNIETDGKENIRLARKEAIRCIQKCIAVLEAKADGRATATPAGSVQPTAEQPENGEVEKEDTKEDSKADTQDMKDVSQKEQKEQKPEEIVEAKPEEIKEAAQPQAADTRPENRAVLVEKTVEQIEADTKATLKKKAVKKRDKSKDNTPKDSTKEDAEKKVESMQVDEKGDKTNSQAMEVDGASASQ